MTIQEKALKLAEYDGYNEKCHIAESIEALQEECIKKYSSFDKLMELLEKVNKANNNYIININEFAVRLDKFSDVAGSRNIGFFMYNTINYSLKESLMDCLLKYYELTKGD